MRIIKHLYYTGQQEFKVYHYVWKFPWKQKTNMVETSDEAVHGTETAGQSYVKPRTSTLQRSELSLDINDILALDLKETPTESQHSGKTEKPEKIKCCPTLIGCGDLSPGYNTYTNPRSCANLHCRDCDFPVSSFPNSEWKECVDYLYLRTNMPNLEKISGKLRRKAGAIAYACHCVSISTEKLQHLHEAGLPWFCRGHV